MVNRPGRTGESRQIDVHGGRYRPCVGSCTFCSIVAGEVPAYLVLDDALAVAFLDTRPLFPGHVLLVPRGHHETLTDLPVELVGPFFERAQRLAARGAARDGRRRARSSR